MLHRLVLAAVALAILSLRSPAPLAVEGTLANPEGRYELSVEPNHTTIAFSVGIAGGMTRVTGKFTRFEVRVVLDENDLAACKVEATIEAASIDTGIDERDEHLRGPDFFDASSHPLLRFRSQRVERREGAYLARGELEMRGRTLPLEVPFRVTRIEHDEGRPRLGVAAVLSLDRRRWDVGTGWRHSVIPDFIADEVTVEIFLWTKLGRPLVAVP